MFVTGIHGADPLSLGHDDADREHAALQAASRQSPMRHYVERLPAIVLDGSGLGLRSPQMLRMLSLRAVLFVAAATMFRRGLVGAS